jgi:hypothetical protein
MTGRLKLILKWAAKAAMPGLAGNAPVVCENDARGYALNTDDGSVVAAVVNPSFACLRFVHERMFPRRAWFVNPAT